MCTCFTITLLGVVLSCILENPVKSSTLPLLVSTNLSLWWLIEQTPILFILFLSNHLQFILSLFDFHSFYFNYNTVYHVRKIQTAC